MTLLFLSKALGLFLAHLPPQRWLCTYRAFTDCGKHARISSAERGGKCCFSTVTGWISSSFQTNWCGWHGQRLTQKPTPLKAGWAGCTTAWAIWSHTGFAAFRKWYSTTGHPGPGIFGQNASEARAFHPTPLCLHRQWHKCTPDGNWGQNMPSWLTRQLASAKARGGN